MPTLTASSSADPTKRLLIVAGEGWSAEKIRLTLNGKSLTKFRAITGTVSRGRVLALNGTFQVEASLPAKLSGSVAVEAREMGGEKRTAAITCEIPDGVSRRRERKDDPRGRLEYLQSLRGHRLTRLKVLRDVQASRGGIHPFIEPQAGAANWSPVGPATIWNGQSLATDADPPLPGRDPNERAPVCGRVTAIALDPLDPDNTIYIGTAMGGVWKTTDGGVNWIPKTDFKESLAIGDLTAVQVGSGTSATTRIYAGTGEANQARDSYYGAGILRSDNAGETWSLMGASEFDGSQIYKVLVDPTNADRVFVACDGGLAMTKDDGSGWTWVTQIRTTDVVLCESTPTSRILLLAFHNGNLQKVQLLPTITPVAPVILYPNKKVSRVTLAQSASHPEVIYAVFGTSNKDTDSAIAGMAGSTNTGDSWTELVGPAGTEQSWFNLALAVPPSAAYKDTVYLGEVHLRRSMNAGVNWLDVSYGTSASAKVALHADQHAIAFHPTNTDRVYAGNDGGIWRSDDWCDTWVSLNKGLSIAQYTGMDAVGGAVILAGAQDNGWQGGFGNPAATLLGFGDGGFAKIGGASPSPWFVTQSSANSLGVHWSTDLGKTWHDPVTTGLPDADHENYGFYPPFATDYDRGDPNYPGALYYGGQHVWCQPAIGQPWVAVSGDLTNGVKDAHITAIRSFGPGALLVGTSNGLAWLVFKASDNWAQEQLTGLPGDRVNQISSEVYNSSVNESYFYWVTAGDSNPHVWIFALTKKSFVAATFPAPNSNAALCVATRWRGPVGAGTVFVGCEVGIYRSDDYGQTWTEWDTGLPNTVVVDLKWVNDGTTAGLTPAGLLYAATHGRGIWERPVAATTTPEVELYMRHSDYDNGVLAYYPAPVPPIPNWPVPVEGAELLEQSLLMSPDVKIDTPMMRSGKLSYQFPNAQIDFADFAQLIDCAPISGQTMRVYVQIRNRGYTTADSVTARVYLCNIRDGSARMNLPQDFWTAFPNGTFASSDFWSAIAPAKTLSNLRQGVPQILEFDWVVPTNYQGLAEQFLFVAVTSPQDPINETSLLISRFVPKNPRTVVKPVDFHS